MLETKKVNTFSKRRQSKLNERNTVKLARLENQTIRATKDLYAITDCDALHEEVKYDRLVEFDLQQFDPEIYCKLLVS